MEHNSIILTIHSRVVHMMSDRCRFKIYSLCKVFTLFSWTLFRRYLNLARILVFITLSFIIIIEVCNMAPGDKQVSYKNLFWIHSLFFFVYLFFTSLPVLQFYSIWEYYIIFLVKKYVCHILCTSMI